MAYPPDYRRRWTGEAQGKATDANPPTPAPFQADANGRVDLPSGRRRASSAWTRTASVSTSEISSPLRVGRVSMTVPF